MEKYKSDRIALGLPRMYLLWEREGYMTDIKSAIEGLEFLCECGEIGLTDEEKQPVQLAIRSLNAWGEVLQELEEVKEYVRGLNTRYYIGKRIGLEEAIDIINQHLVEIEE